MRVAIIGLDSVPPELLFDKLLDRLPNISRLYANGIHGRLRTCDPPITVPAWMVMMTGRNPGELGIYGFRHRKGASYSDGYIVNSTNVARRTVWEVLSDRGKRSVVLGVPPSYPPKHVANSNIVSCFITPSQDKQFTYPEELRDEVLEQSKGKYIFDVTFRTEDRESIRKQLFEMTEKRFDVAEYLARTKPWEFFMMHEIGFDRLHHAFWKFFDPSHPKYVKGNPFERIDEEYYRMVDGRIGRLLEIFGGDCTTMLVSDHGSKAMLGAFCVNQWLESEGYLVFKKRPESPIDLDQAQVDWSRTKAWGWGGYYARIFFNVEGREAQGVIEPSQLEAEKKELTRRIMTIKDPSGRTMKNSVLEPKNIYGKAIGDRPDLMVYFDDLNWRSAGTVGHPTTYLSENDTGPDDSVHSMDGILVLSRPGLDLGGRELEGAMAQDIGATVLSMLGIPPEKEGIGGRAIRELVEA